MNVVSETSDSSSYQQVGKILTQVKNSHLALREQLQNGELTSNEELMRVRESLVRSEDQAIAALEDYVRDGNPEVLEAWIQYVPLEEMVEAIQQIHLEDNLSTDELIAHKARYDDAVLHLYEHLARTTAIPVVEEAFQQLVEQTKQEMAQQSWRYRDSDLA